MPFGKYKNFEACVRANQDKESPEGYCASIEHAITGQWPGQIHAVAMEKMNKKRRKGK